MDDAPATATSLSEGTVSAEPTTAGEVEQATPAPVPATPLLTTKQEGEAEDKERQI